MTPETAASIRAMLDLDAAGALVPHGIGGLARDLFERVLAEASTPTAYRNQRIDGTWTPRFTRQECETIAARSPQFFARVAVPFVEYELP